MPRSLPPFRRFARRRSVGPVPFTTATLIGAWLVALAIPAGGTGAQSAQRWSLQGSALTVGVSGDAYEGLASGVGGEMQLRFTPGRLSVGLGGQSSWHDLDLDEFGTETVRLAGAFIEPRFVFDVGADRYAPYAAARLAVLTQRVDLGDGVDASASGTQLNLGGGLLVRLTPRVNLDLGLTVGSIDFDDVEITLPGEGTFIVTGSSGSGTNLVLRAGLAIGLF
jgi:hypothetical protein